MVPLRRTFWDPVNAWFPVQSPLARQDVAFEELQESVANCPGSTEVGVTAMVNWAAGGVGVIGGRTVSLPFEQPERTNKETAARQKHLYMYNPHIPSFNVVL